MAAKLQTTETGLDAVTVHDAMHHGVITCPPRAPLREVARLLALHRIHAVVVYSDGFSHEEDDAEDTGPIWGVVSDSDLAAAAAVRDVDSRTAGGTARTAPVSVAPDATLQDAARLMREHRVTHLIVVEPGTGRPIGMVSTLDIARSVALSSEQ